MTHQEIERRVLAKPDFESRFNELVVYYPLLASGRLYTYDEDGLEKERIYCACDGCRYHPDTMAHRAFFEAAYRKEFAKARVFFEANNSLLAKFNYWVRNDLSPFISYSESDDGSDRISVIPMDKKEFAEYNRLVYHYIKHSTNGVPRSMTLGGRVAEFEVRMSRAIYPDEVLEKAKIALRKDFESHRMNMQRVIFEDLLNGGELDWSVKTWDYGECMDNVIANEAFLFLKYLETYGKMRLDEPFLEYVAHVFGDDDLGMDWSAIAKFFQEQAVRADISFPYQDERFPDDGSIISKKAGIMANLEGFFPEKRYTLIMDLALAAPDVASRHQLISRMEQLFGPMSASFDGISRDLIGEVQLGLELYGKAAEKFRLGIRAVVDKSDNRSAMDNLRLCLELFLKQLLGNNKPLEKQDTLGKYLKEKGVPTELRSMLLGLLDFYTKYQNDYVKHNDKVEEADINTILYLTATFLQRLLRAQIERQSDLPAS
ncbi:hypothetical protein [Chitinophaga rhizosphaerae]|uniref:hypothetical protein n=1 Tax=Chitinophaga rhizosphaerae TaxID=1864947 RepID=UPI000F807517|nr:hypothetical protein [Chitinophaga rhizosphaerae]